MQMTSWSRVLSAVLMGMMSWGILDRQDLGPPLIEHVLHALHGQEAVGVLLLPDPVEEDGQVVVEVQLLDVDLPVDDVLHPLVLHGHRQVVALVELPELRVGRVRPLPEGARARGGRGRGVLLEHPRLDQVPVPLLRVVRRGLLGGLEPVPQRAAVPGRQRLGLVQHGVAPRPHIVLQLLRHVEARPRLRRERVRALPADLHVAVRVREQLPRHVPDLVVRHPAPLAATATGSAPPPAPALDKPEGELARAVGSPSRHGGGRGARGAAARAAGAPGARGPPFGAGVGPPGGAPGARAGGGGLPPCSGMEVGGSRGGPPAPRAGGRGGAGPRPGAPKILRDPSTPPPPRPSPLAARPRRAPGPPLALGPSALGLEDAPPKQVLCSPFYRAAVGAAPGAGRRQAGRGRLRGLKETCWTAWYRPAAHPPATLPP